MAAHGALVGNAGASRDGRIPKPHAACADRVDSCLMGGSDVACRGSSAQCLCTRSTGACSRSPSFRSPKEQSLFPTGPRTVCHATAGGESARQEQLQIPRRGRALVADLRSTSRSTRVRRTPVERSRSRPASAGVWRSRLVPSSHPFHLTALVSPSHCRRGIPAAASSRTPASYLPWSPHSSSRHPARC